MRGVGSSEDLDGPIVQLQDTSAVISSLVAGYSYSPRVTATNDMGSTTAECPQVTLVFGKKLNTHEENLMLWVLTIVLAHVCLLYLLQKSNRVQ